MKQLKIKPFKKLNKKNTKQFKHKNTLEKTEKLTPKSWGHNSEPPSFPQIQNYFGVWGHNSVPKH